MLAALKLSSFPPRLRFLGELPEEELPLPLLEPTVPELVFPLGLEVVVVPLEDPLRLPDRTVPDEELP